MNPIGEPILAANLIPGVELTKSSADRWIELRASSTLNSKGGKGNGGLQRQQTMSKRGSTQTIQNIPRDESAVSLALGNTGPLDMPPLKEVAKFEAAVENVPPGVTLMEFERIVKLNKATDP